jgi:hypothetical protein
MKTYLLLATAITALTLSGCSGTAERKARIQDKGANPAFMFWCFRKEILQAEYHIPEMETSEAAVHIQARLKTLPGFVDSTCDLSKNILTVRYESSILRTMNIEEAIALSGFAVNNRPAAAKAKRPAGAK